MEMYEENCKFFGNGRISAQETKQTNKQNNLLTLTLSCEKSSLIRRKKK